MSDYLWDPGADGEDAEVAHLEALLQPLAYRGQPPSLPPRRTGRALWLLAAGATALAALIALLVWRPPSRPAGWAMTVVRDGHETAGKLDVGVWLDTGDHRAQLRIVGVGTVELEPGTRVRIVESGEKRDALQLDHGAISAVVTAPPRHFVVETQHATAIDLGCAFTLSVDEAGRGKLAVSAGAVALAQEGAAEVVVTAGSECGIGERGPEAPQISARAIATPATPVAPVKVTPSEKTETRTRTGTRPKTRTATQTQTPSSSTKPKTQTPSTKTQKTPATPPSNDFSHDSLKDLDHSIP